MPVHHNNIVLGSGQLYLALIDKSGRRGGFRYFGDTPGFSIQVTTERTTVYGSDGPTKYKLVDKVIQTDLNGSFTARDISDENIELFIGGQASTVSQLQKTGESEMITSVQPGLWYIIGAGAHLTGVRNITNVTVSDTAQQPQAFALGTDYEVDLQRGRVYIVKGGAIAASTDIKVSFDTPANQRSQIRTTETVGRTVALHYLAHNSEGENRDILLPYAELSPDGEVGWKDLENPQQFGFSFEALVKDSATPAMLIDGVAYSAP